MGVAPSGKLAGLRIMPPLLITISLARLLGRPPCGACRIVVCTFTLAVIYILTSHKPEGCSLYKHERPHKPAARFGQVPW